MAIEGGRLIRFGRWGAPAQPADPAEMFAAMPTPLLLLDGEGCVREANGAAEAFLNLARATLIGRAVETLIGHRLAVVPNDAPFAAYDLVLTLPGGRRCEADVVAAPLPDRVGWRAVTIHGRVPAHLAGRRAEREGGQRSATGAAAMLAHEIKNPLSAIRGAAQLLEAEGGGALTALIRDEVDRIAALIDRMERFTDTRPLALAPQNIHAILAHARDVALTGFAEGFTVREEYDPSLPAVLGHRDSLVQVLLNLLKNAAEAMTAPGTITLRTGYRHGLSTVAGKGAARRSLPIEVCVIDEGPGAPAEMAAHLFEPFVSSKRAGGGLGLALVDKLVGDGGGLVEYAREGEPQRTVFRLLLPRAG